MSCFAVFDVIDLAFRVDEVVKRTKRKVAIEPSDKKKQPKLLLGPSTTSAPPVTIAYPSPSSKGQSVDPWSIIFAGVILG